MHLWIINEERKMYIKKTVAFRMLADYPIPLYQNHKVHFRDVVNALAEKVMKDISPSSELWVKEGPVQRQIKMTWKRKFKILKTLKKNQMIADEMIAG